MSDSKSAQKLRDAQELYRQERWSEALCLFDDLSLSYKSDNDIMLNRAMCLARIGKEEEAELLCDHVTVVHRDPRGAQLKAQIPRAKREGKTAPLEEEKRKPLLSIDVIKNAIVVCFVLSLAIAGWTFYSTYEPPVPPTIVTMAAPGERSLYFPKDASLGMVSIRDWGYANNPQGEHVQNNWQQLGEAKGKLTIPAGKEVQLRVEPSQVANLPALRRLAPNDLQTLLLDACAVNDEAVASIAHLTGLFYLSIDNTLIGPDGYQTLRRLTSLRNVSIIDTVLGESGRIFIAQQSFLAHIDADRADLGDDWLMGLPPMEKLVFLSLDNSERITDDGIKHLSKQKSLEHLFLSYTGLTDEGMKSVQSLKSLRRGWFENTKITDACMAGFRLMPNIEEIGVAYTKVSDSGLMELSDIRTLKRVGLKGCHGITADGIRRFKARNPNCVVETTLTL